MPVYAHILGTEISNHNEANENSYTILSHVGPLSSHNQNKPEH